MILEAEIGASGRMHLPRGTRATIAAESAGDVRGRGGRNNASDAKRMSYCRVSNGNAFPLSRAMFICTCTARVKDDRLRSFSTSIPEGGTEI